MLVESYRSFPSPVCAISIQISVSKGFWGHEDTWDAIANVDSTIQIESSTHRCQGESETFFKVFLMF